MKTVETIQDFAQMHLDLGLAMSKSVFRETIPMIHKIVPLFPTVHQIFLDFVDDDGRGYNLTHAQAVVVTEQLKRLYHLAIDGNYAGFGGAGSIFTDQLVRYSQTDEGKAYGLQATRNFRLRGAIHFETKAQAQRFLADWIAVREKLIKGEEE